MFFSDSKAVFGVKFANRMPSCFGGEKYEISFTISWCRPGSTITLTAETIRVRDAIIEKFSDKSLLELNSFIETALGTEQNENKRLGILAARVYILRVRMQNIASFNAIL